MQNVKDSLARFTGLEDMDDEFSPLLEDLLTDPYSSEEDRSARLAMLLAKTEEELQTLFQKQERLLATVTKDKKRTRLAKEQMAAAKIQISLAEQQIKRFPLNKTDGLIKKENEEARGADDDDDDDVFVVPAFTHVIDCSDAEARQQELDRARQLEKADAEQMQLQVWLMRRLDCANKKPRLQSLHAELVTAKTKNQLT